MTLRNIARHLALGVAAGAVLTAGSRPGGGRQGFGAGCGQRRRRQAGRRGDGETHQCRPPPDLHGGQPGPGPLPGGRPAGRPVHRAGDRGRLRKQQVGAGERRGRQERQDRSRARQQAGTAAAAGVAAPPPRGADFQGVSQTLPAGDGQALVAARCTTCHNLQRIVVKRTPLRGMAAHHRAHARHHGDHERPGHLQ